MTLSISRNFEILSKSYEESHVASVNKSRTCFPETLQHAKFCQQHGVDGQSQLGSHQSGGNFLYGNLAEGLPGGRSELGFHLLQ